AAQPGRGRDAVQAARRRPRRRVREPRLRQCLAARRLRLPLAPAHVNAAAPPPAAPIPAAPAAIVAKLQETRRALDDAIDRWDTTKAPPRDVTLLALYEQRTIRFVARDT